MQMPEQHLPFLHVETKLHEKMLSSRLILYSAKRVEKHQTKGDTASIFDPVFQHYEYKLQDPIILEKKIVGFETRITQDVPSDFIILKHKI